MKMMIIKADQDYDINLIGEEEKKNIRTLGVKFTGQQITGSKFYYSKKLMLVMSNLDKAELTAAIEKGFNTFDDNGNEIVLDLGLNWKIVAVEGEKIDDYKIINFMDDIAVYSDEEEYLYDEKVTSAKGLLQTISGKEWIYD